MFNIFEEIPWFYFKELPEVKYLPIHEQVDQYNRYLDILSFERINYLSWLDSQGKGAPVTAIPDTGDQTWSTTSTKWEDAVGFWEG